MYASLSRFSISVVVIVSLAGCGGSSNSSSTGGGGTGGTDGGSTSVTFTITGGTPIAVATQVGSGSFTAARLSGGSLTLSLPSGTSNFAVAYACSALPWYMPPVTPTIDEYVYQASTQDGTSLRGSCANLNSSQGRVTVQVSTSAIPGANMVTVQGLAMMEASGGTIDFSGTMTAGTYDVFIFVQDIDNNLLALKVLRSQTIPGALNGGNPVIFQTSDETTLQAITYSNPPSGFSPSQYILYETSGGASTTLDVLGSTTQYPAMPVSAFQNGDYYLFDAAASSGNEAVGVEKFTSSVGPQGFTFPAPWTYPGPTAAALPTINFDYPGFSGMSSVSSVAAIQWNRGNGTPLNNGISVFTTANYRNGATAVTIPDLSGVRGFLAPAASGSTIEWFATVQQGDPAASTPPSGTVQYVVNNGTYTVP
jgi:hypothetical protein